MDRQISLTTSARELEGPCTGHHLDLQFKVRKSEEWDEQPFVRGGACQATTDTANSVACRPGKARAMEGAGKALLVGSCTRSRLPSLKPLQVGRTHAAKSANLFCHAECRKCKQAAHMCQVSCCPFGIVE